MLFRSASKAAVNPQPVDSSPDTTSSTSSFCGEEHDENAVSSADDNLFSERTQRQNPEGQNSSQKYVHDLREGDHIVRWIMLGYCYPVQVHGIVLSVGPDLVTIVDCGLSAVKNDKVGSFDDDGKTSSRFTRTRRRMNVLTLIDEKEIKKWKKVHYGEEYEIEIRAENEHNQSFDGVSADEGLENLENEEPTEHTDPMRADEDNSTEQHDEPETINLPKKTSSLSWFCNSKSGASNLLEQSEHDESQEASTSTSQQQVIKKECPQETSSNSFRLPKSDPPALVIARLRFLLEHSEENDTSKIEHTTPLLPPHHIFYANSECIAVWIKTGHWSTLQAAVFLHSSTIGNVKQTATLAMYLGAQTVTIPAAGIWGFFGGTTTISLFSAQPWIVPALVGGGMVYAGLPTMVLWRAKSQWLETEHRLNVAFWEQVDSSTIVNLIQTWSGLDE